MAPIRDHFNIVRSVDWAARRALRWAPLIAVFAAMAVAGCATVIDQRGKLPEPERIGEIQPGTTTKDQVVRILGSPSSVSTFDDKTWYYISSRSKQFSFLQPTLIDQQVFIVDFGDNGVVRNLGHKELADARPVTPAPGATPSPGRELSFLEQLIGNVGKFGGSDNGQDKAGK